MSPLRRSYSRGNPLHYGRSETYRVPVGPSVPGRIRHYESLYGSVCYKVSYVPRDLVIVYTYLVFSLGALFINIVVIAVVNAYLYVLNVFNMARQVKRPLVGHHPVEDGPLSARVVDVIRTVHQRYFRGKVIFGINKIYQRYGTVGYPRYLPGFAGDPPEVILVIVLRIRRGPVIMRPHRGRYQGKFSVYFENIRVIVRGDYIGHPRIYYPEHTVRGYRVRYRPEIRLLRPGTAGTRAVWNYAVVGNAFALVYRHPVPYTVARGPKSSSLVILAYHYLAVRVNVLHGIPLGYVGGAGASDTYLVHRAYAPEPRRSRTGYYRAPVCNSHGSGAVRTGRVIYHYLIHRTAPFPGYVVLAVNNYPVGKTARGHFFYPVNLYITGYVERRTLGHYIGFGSPGVLYPYDSLACRLIRNGPRPCMFRSRSAGTCAVGHNTVIRRTVILYYLVKRPGTSGYRIHYFDLGHCAFPAPCYVVGLTYIPYRVLIREFDPQVSLYPEVGGGNVIRVRIYRAHYTHPDRMRYVVRHGPRVRPGVARRIGYDLALRESRAAVGRVVQFHVRDRSHARPLYGVNIPDDIFLFRGRIKREVGPHLSFCRYPERIGSVP